jgi:hypothetical protein
LLAAANRIDPDDPEPLIAFYESFRIQGIEPTENAAIGLERAFELAPEDMGLRMSVAFHLLTAERPSEARSLLQAMAYHPHGGGMSAFARDIIATIDKGGAKEALARWQNGGSEPGEEKKASGDSSSAPSDSSTSTQQDGGN